MFSSLPAEVGNADLQPPGDEACRSVAPLGRDSGPSY